MAPCFAMGWLLTAVFVDSDFTANREGFDSTTLSHAYNRACYRKWHTFDGLLLTGVGSCTNFFTFDFPLVTSSLFKLDERYDEEYWKIKDEAVQTRFMEVLKLTKSAWNIGTKCFDGRRTCYNNNNRGMLFRIKHVALGYNKLHLTTVYCLKFNNITVCSP